MSSSSSEVKPGSSQQAKITTEKPAKREKKSKDSKEKDIKRRIKEVSPKALVKKLSLMTEGKKNKEKRKAKEDSAVDVVSERSDSTVSKETICSIDNSTVELDSAASKDDDIRPGGEIEISDSPLKQSESSEINSPGSTAELSATPSTPRLVDASFEDIPSMDFLTPRNHEASVGPKRECLYKILVIGELGTGKTSIIKRYVHQFFSQHYRATIGVDFALKVLYWDQNTIIRLQLWDIAGQERFGNMTRVYYKEAVGAFIVFDVSRAATFDAVVKWKLDLDAKVQLPDGSPIPCVLLANKCDQQKEGIVNQPNKMDEYCNEHKFTGWFETSAKENINIEEAAKLLVTQILNNDVTTENGRSPSDSNRISLDGKPEDVQQKSCKC